MVSSAIACASEGCRVLCINTVNGVSTSMLKRCVQECSLDRLPAIKFTSDSKVDIDKLLESAIENFDIARFFELTFSNGYMLTDAAPTKKYDFIIIDLLNDIPAFSGQFPPSNSFNAYRRSLGG